MTIHMVRVVCEPPKGNAETAVDNWVENYTEWTDDSVEHSLTETTAGLDGDGTTYVRGDWRFEEQGETPTDILEDLSDRLQSFQGGLWHRLVYHVCPHDGTAKSVTETVDLAPEESATLKGSVSGSVIVENDGTAYTQGEDYTVSGKTITVSEDSAMTDDEYEVSYETKACWWDEKVEWGDVPEDIPDYEVDD